MNKLAIERPYDVRQRTKLSRTTLYKKIKEGTFPAPIKLGARAIGFLTSDVDAWIEACAAASKEGK